jgi:hypothetical protein
MALPRNAQDGDIAIDQGVWYGRKGGVWSRVQDSDQTYMNRHFFAVTGTGSNQKFVTHGGEQQVSKTDVLEGLRSPTARRRWRSASDQDKRTSTRERFLAAWSEFSGGRDFPPYIENNPDYGLDGDVLRAFMSYFETVDPVASQPQSYTLDNGEVYTILPGGKVIKEGTKDPQTGELTKTLGSSEVFIDDTTKRTFIRNPDGTIEYVPDQKVSTEQGDAIFKYNQEVGRFVITQPDGTIQFGPEKRQQANISTDSSGRRILTQPDGSIQYLGREFEPGVISRDGYNLLQQPSGALSQLAPLPEPAGIETVGGMQFIRTSTGELMPLDNVLNRMMENMVVTGDLEGAAAIHAWQTRPSNQEYFDRALAYMRSPADQLVISAIARGQGLVSPPPEETIQRIGPQPDYLTEAFNMLQDQMQMGLPEGTQTFADTLAERAALAEVEALELANETTRINNNNTQVAGEDAHNANLIANANARNEGDAFVINSNFDFQDRIALASGVTGDDDDEPVDSPVIDRGGRPGGMPQLQWDYQKAVEAYNDAMGWTGRTPGNPLSPADQLIGDAARGGATIANQIAILEQNTPAPEEPPKPPGEMPAATGPIDTSGQMSAIFDQPYDPITVPEGPGLLSVGEESEEQVAPLTFEEAIASIGREGTVYTQPDEEEEEEVVASDPVSFDEPDAVSFVEPTAPDIYDDPSAMLTTEEALAEIGADPGLSYAGVDEPDWDADVMQGTEDDWFAGGGIYDDNTAIVGESGPELAIFPNGTEIVPLDRRMKPSQARRLRRRGIRGMQEGGLVFDSPLPLGIRQLQAGRSLGAPRGQLLRTAGIALPSAQARRRMLPSEQEAFGELGRLAGIPEGEFRQELGITTPSGAPRTGSARMLPLSLRR